MILLLPGEKLGGHYHHKVEETFYVVEGKGCFIVNGQDFSAEPGDVFRIETNDKHDILNNGMDNLKLVFIKCPYLPKDKVDI